MTLSPSEIKVADLVADGHANKEIALRLGIGESTVKAHVAQAMRKLNFTNRTQLALLIARRRWEAERAYRPISELPDVEYGHVVVCNTCNGPELQVLVVPEDAAELRSSGVWTHFLPLPDTGEIDAAERRKRACEVARPDEVPA